jgi:RND family efflux transporter MFP subunit
VEVAAAELERARRDRDLRIEERLRVETAEAAVELAQGTLAERQASSDEAQLRLERMVVRAPARGVVLERLATVGSELGGAQRAVATLYDPASIRVRVDVPQQDLAVLFVGQRARIESDARPGHPYQGEVIRIVRRADVQKVTMQAHVRLLDGDDLLRPEMLVQVRFLAPDAEGAAQDAVGQAVAVPARLVREGGEVWVLDVERGAAVLRRVRVGARDGDLVVIEQGLDLSDKLVDAGDSPLREGERVRAREQPR